MKKLYFLVMLSVVFNNVVQAQDTIPEQRVTDPLKVQTKIHCLKMKGIEDEA